MLYKLKRKCYRLASPAIRKIFSMKGVDLGQTELIGMPWIQGKVQIKSGILVSIAKGNFLYINKPCSLISLEEGNIDIGKNFRASGVSIVSSSSIKIGDNVMIAPRVTIIDSNMHSTNHIKRRLGDHGKTSPIVIGNDVWICQGATILKGVKIGDRAIIGPNLVIRKDVQSDAIIY